MKKINYESFGLLVIAFSVVLTGFSQQNLVPQPLPCLLINSQNASYLNGLYTNQRCIEVGGEVNETAINVYGNNQINLKAGKDIHVASNTHIKPYGNGSVHAYIASDPVEVVWFEPNSTPGLVGKFNRLELGFRLPAAVNQQVNNFISNGVGGVNPFDPDQIDFRVHLTAPDGSTLTRFAFYYKPYNENLTSNSINEDTTSFPWRFRFAPPQIGVWNLSIEVIIAGASTIQESGLSFTCVPSNHKGVLQWTYTNTNADRWLRYSETNETFFAIAENISSGGFCSYLPAQNHRQMNGVQELINVGGNFTRFELSGQGPLPDWPVYNNYNNKLDEMYSFDKLIDLCEDNNIYFTIFRHHVEVNEAGQPGEPLGEPSWNGVSWFENSYRQGFSLNSVEEYFAEASVIAWQNKNLRYIFSRWGYSPNMSFYGYSEIELWYSKMLIDDDENEQTDGGSLEEEECISTMTEWCENQQNFIRQNFSNMIMFCNSYGVQPDKEFNVNFHGMYDISDVIAIHSYEKTKKINFIKRYETVEKLWNKYKKPILVEEMGAEAQLYCCTGIDQHNAIWSTAMMGDFGTGMEWSWDRGVHDFGYYLDLKNIQMFFQYEELRERQYKPQKWNDAIIYRNSKIENYSLKSENKENVLGWVHNSTYYWRNLGEILPCINELVTTNGMSTLDLPVIFGERVKLCR